MRKTTCGDAERGRPRMATIVYTITLLLVLSFVSFVSCSSGSDVSSLTAESESLQTLVWQLESQAKQDQLEMMQDRLEAEEDQARLKAMHFEAEADSEFDEDAALLESAAIIHAALTADGGLDAELLETQGQFNARQQCEGMDGPTIAQSLPFFSLSVHARQSISDLGVSVPVAEAKLHFKSGWFDALGRGANNDYCRFGQRGEHDNRRGCDGVSLDCGESSDFSSFLSVLGHQLVTIVVHSCVAPSGTRSQYSAQVVSVSHRPVRLSMVTFSRSTVATMVRARRRPDSVHAETDSRESNVRFQTMHAQMSDVRTHGTCTQWFYHSRRSWYQV